MTVSFDLSGLVRAAQAVRGSAKAAQQTVARARATVKRRLPVEARRDIAAEYALPARRIAAGLSIRDAGDAVELIGAKRGINAIEFGATWSRKNPGARWRVKVGQGVSAQDGSFIATVRGGNRLVLERALRGSRLVPRLPIQSVYGPSVAQMLRRPGRAERLATFAQTVLAAEIERLLR